MSDGRWFDERAAPGVRVSYEAGRVLHHTRTGSQETLFMDNPQFGRMLMLDGVVQVTAADEFIYHEMMSHVPLLAHGSAEHVLIVGGGDCGLAEEVLKHRSVKRLIQVEIDPQIVSLSREHLGSMNAPVFQDPRFILETGDGAEYVATTEHRFDVILIDSTDPGAASLPLFTETFYRYARGCLKPRGLLVAQLGVPFLHPMQFSASMKRLAATFPEVSCYLVPVPTYFGGPIALGWASNVLAPGEPGVEQLTERYAAAQLTTRYYTPEVHRAAFALPRYLQDEVAAAIRPDKGPSA